MFAFHFALRPVSEIEPWGQSSPALHWFGLTDGTYWIEAGEHGLLRYSETNPGSGDGSGSSSSPVEYQVARLWEDVIEMTPQALEPAPSDLRDFLASDPAHWTQSDEEEALAAGEWHAAHELDLGYLSAAPHIQFQRNTDVDDSVTIAWRHRVPNDIAFDAADRGWITVPTESFSSAVRELDEFLLQAMDERVTELERNGPPAGVHIDLHHLRQEQVQRATWLELALRRTPHTDWDVVRRGAAKLLSETPTGS